MLAEIDPLAQVGQQHGRVFLVQEPGLNSLGSHRHGVENLLCLGPPVRAADRDHPQAEGVRFGLAVHETVGAVILEAPFTSIGAVARRLSFGLPIDYILSTRYDSRSKASSIRAPVAVIHANRDPVIPFELGMDLYQQFPGPKRFFEVQGEIHEGAFLALGVERTRELKEFVFPK